jgi:MtN3 and saliva related transmembrane protein
MEPLQMIVGLVAGAVMTSSLLPQIYKMLKTKKAGDISLLMLAVIWCGTTLWFLYGVLGNDNIIMLWNGCSVILGGITVGLKIWYDRKKKPEKNYDSYFAQY